MISNNKALFLKKLGLSVKWIILITGSFVMLYPMVFMVLAGLFSKEEYWSATLTLLPFPENPTLKNYFALFNTIQYPNMSIYAFNSLIITVSGSLMTVLTTLICGFCFSRLKWKGREFVLFILLSTAMLPGTTSLIPRYIMYASWPFSSKPGGILDTYWMYLIGMPSINIMGTFIVTQYFRTIPMSLDESAKMDGANIVQVIIHIIFPIAKPVFGYIIITTMIGLWNDWSTGFFFTSSDNLMTLPVALSRLAIDNVLGIPDYPFIITLGLALTLPILLIYLIFQRYIIEGIANVGIKG